MRFRGRIESGRRGRSRRNLAFESLEHRALLAGDPILDGQAVMISELVADNHSTLLTRTRTSALERFEGEADAPDWIELYNISSRRLDLGGMHLTDDAADPTKWQFPPGTWIDAGAFLVVFASGRDIRDRSLDEQGLLHTNFLLASEGEYLALTGRDGTLVHEYSPKFPAQRMDVSYSVPMDVRTLVGADAPLEYLVPADDSLEPDWRMPGFADPRLVRALAGSPVGFDRGGGLAEPGERIGAELVNRTSMDFSRGSIVVLESMPFTAAGRVAEWSFYSTTTRSITPLVFRVAGDQFEIVGIGRTRTSDGSGAQTFAFDLQSGSDAVDATEYFFGFKDGDNTTDDPGVVGWSRSDTDSVRRYNGPLSGSVVLGQKLSAGSKFGRTYSVQAATRARLAGSINTDVASVTSRSTSLYVRYPFVTDQIEALRSLSLNVRYDDGFVAYLNGREVARRNVPDTVHFDSQAVSNRLIQDANRFEEINITEFLDALREGENVLALHGFNEDSASSEFLIDARLMGTDIRSVAGVGFASEPTPGVTNGRIFAGFVGAPSFSHGRGFYEQPFTVQLATPGMPDAAIYVTNDGSDPVPENPKASRYQQPLEIGKTMTLRAASYQDGWLPSLPQTHTFIFPKDVVAQSTMQRTITEDPVWGPQLKDSLLALPTISLVTQDSISIGREVGTSVELIFPDGAEGFQVDAGVEPTGGTSLAFPKHSLRLSFKKIHGPSMLQFDVFDDPDGVKEFDQLLLRAGAQDSLFTSDPTIGGSSYIRNRWAYNRQLEMGQPAPRGRFVQLYLNGTYWGIYELMERPNAAFMAARFGGDKSDYDVLNAGNPIGSTGDDAAWKALIDAIDDGYDAVQRYLDVVNYADYMLLQFFGGNDWDWRADFNWIAARRREPGAGFQFFAWDSDVMLRRGANSNVVNFGSPGYLWTLHGGVQQYPEFLRLMAQRAQEYFFNGGMFTSERLRSDIDALAEQIRVAIIAESARWGSGLYTPAMWESAIEWIKQTYAPEGGVGRAEIVIEQMRQAGLFPLADTPRLAVDGQPLVGNFVPAGAQLAMSAPQGDIYYTLDGSDPWRSVPAVTNTTLIDASADVRVLIPRDNTLQSDWLAPDFDDSTWTSGRNGIGYDVSGGFTPLIGLNVQQQMKGVNASVYLRVPFQVDDPSLFDTLQFSMRYDDGFVAYLNGQEIARRNAPAAVTWNSRASMPRANVEAVELERFNLSRLRHLLRPGRNVLAIHGLNAEPDNVDLLITPLLQAGKVNDTGVSPTAIRFTGPITVPPDARIKARTVWGDQWSPLREASVPAPLFPLRVSEVMFHPANPTASERAAGITDADEFEFIELVNISDLPINLADVQFVETQAGGQTDGIAFDFGTGGIRQLAPGQPVLVVENSTAFAFRYGTQLPVAGEWSGGLSNNAEEITLMVGGQLLQQFTYDDDWYPAADGNGASLEIIDVTSPDLERWNRRAGWRPSSVEGGTPGRAAGVDVPGDSNRDGVFNSSDLVVVFQTSEYEDDVPGNSTFEEGDWNGDGDFTTADFVFAFKMGSFVAGAAALNARANQDMSATLLPFARSGRAWARHIPTESTRRLPPHYHLARADLSPTAHDLVFQQLAEPGS